MRNRCSFGLLWMMAAAICGCSGSSHDIAPVTGKVTLDGEPLAGASVTFMPVGSGTSEAGPVATATTDDQGTFTLKTADGEDGATVGKNRVMIFSVGDDVAGAGPDAEDDNVYDDANAEKVPARYNTDTQLEFEVPADGATDANFELTSERDMRDNVGRSEGDFGS